MAYRGRYKTRFNKFRRSYKRRSYGRRSFGRRRNFKRKAPKYRLAGGWL